MSPRRGDPRPVLPHWAQIGDALRRARGQVRQVDLARALGWGQSAISRVESGRQAVDRDDVRAWAAALDVDPEPLLDVLDRALVRLLDIRAAARRPGGVEALQGDLETLEAASSTIAEYQPELIPGLGQTTAYTRAWLTQPGRVELGGEVDVEAVVTARAGRRQRLAGRPILLAVRPQALTAVYGPGAAGIAVQRAQLDALTSAAGNGRFELIVVQRPLAILHGFELLDDVVVAEGVVGAHVMADPNVVEQFRVAWARIRETGLTGARAVREVERAREGLGA